jgi:hypothetical protein
MLSSHISGVEVLEGSADFHEAGKLGLNSSLATKTFGWNPKWTTAQSIEATAYWYKAFLAKDKQARQLCLEQIELWTLSGN